MLADLLFNSDFDSLKFPNRCSRKQFLDYFNVIFVSFQLAKTQAHIDAIVKAVKTFCSHFYFSGNSIRRSKRRPRDDRNQGDNLNPAA